MIKFLLILLFGCSIILKESFYYIPKLSELKGKEFSEYIDYLTRDL